MKTPTLTDDEYPTPTTLVSAAILRSIGTTEPDNLVEIDVSHVNRGPVRDALMAACEQCGDETFYGPRERWKIHLTTRPAPPIQRVVFPERRKPGPKPADVAPLQHLSIKITSQDSAALDRVAARTGLTRSAAAAWAMGEGLRATEAAR